MNMTTPVRSPAQWRFTLATDLDGTFLGGSDAQRAELYDWLAAQRQDVGLIFVSGRDPEFIQELCGDGFVPWPDYVIGDVGTTIAKVTDTRSIAPIVSLEEDIAARWNDSGDRVRDALDGVAGLTLQPTDFRYRVSYDYDPETFDPAAHDRVAELELDVLISDNRFFDVLPKGVSKGPSLIRLIDHLGLSPDAVLAAGDTLNDLSMLKVGVPAVAVGGAEPALTKALEGHDHVHHADAVGAAGILEAIAAKNLHPSLKER